jgi:hypothetical protein
MIAFRQIARADDRRTFIPCLIPPFEVTVDGAPNIRVEDPVAQAALLGVLSSTVFDWYMRRWVEVNVNQWLLLPAPVPVYEPAGRLWSRLTHCAVRLAAVHEGFETWSTELIGGFAVTTNAHERADLISELDALAFLLYGLNESQVMHVFETFHKGAYDHNHLERVQNHYSAWKAKA